MIITGIVSLTCFSRHGRPTRTDLCLNRNRKEIFAKVQLSITAGSILKIKGSPTGELSCRRSQLNNSALKYLGLFLWWARFSRRLQATVTAYHRVRSTLVCRPRIVFKKGVLDKSSFHHFYLTIYWLLKIHKNKHYLVKTAKTIMLIKEIKEPRNCHNTRIYTSN